MNDNLQFLDLIYIRNESNIEFDIYRNRTNTNRFILSISNH